MNAKKVLLLFAHPSIERSEVNRPMLQAARSTPGVTVVDLYGEYPTYQIDIDREQRRLLAHDVIIFMFPLYWYSTPSILKEWQDLVLEYGFAYGREGTALHGKVFLCVVSAGGAEQAYRREGHNQHTIRQLLRPLEQMADLCGMRFIPPFVLFSSRTAADEQRLERHLVDWQRALAALRDDRIDLRRAQALPRLDAYLDRLIGPPR